MFLIVLAGVGLHQLYLKFGPRFKGDRFLAAGAALVLLTAPSIWRWNVQTDEGIELGSREVRPEVLDIGEYVKGKGLIGLVTYDLVNQTRAWTDFVSIIPQPRIGFPGGFSLELFGAYYVDSNAMILKKNEDGDLVFEYVANRNIDHFPAVPVDGADPALMPALRRVLDTDPQRPSRAVAVEPEGERLAVARELDAHGDPRHGPAPKCSDQRPARPRLPAGRPRSRGT